MKWRTHPDEIVFERLPKARVGGYAVEPTDELLRQIVWDYRQSIHDHDRAVKENVELQARIEELEAEVESLRAGLVAADGRAERIEATLVTARRAARDTRESARAEAELALKKARKRVEALDKVVRQAHDVRDAELEKLAAEKERVRTELQDYLLRTLAALGDTSTGAGRRQSLLEAIGGSDTSTFGTPTADDPDPLPI